MASWAFPFNFCFIKWLFSRDLHYLRSGITAARRITPGTNSHLRVPRLRSPPSPEFPFPHSSPPYHKASREWGEPSAGQQTRSNPPARGTALSPPPPPQTFLPLPKPPSRTPQPVTPTRSSTTATTHAARGGEGRKREGGSGTRGRAGPSAPYAPRRPQAPTRGGAARRRGLGSPLPHPPPHPHRFLLTRCRSRPLPAATRPYPSRGSRPRSPRCDRGPSRPRLSGQGPGEDKSLTGRSSAAQTETKAQRTPKRGFGEGGSQPSDLLFPIPAGMKPDGTADPPRPDPPARSCAAPFRSYK